MNETYSICGYTRISVDLDEDRDNTSIENQKAIIEDYVRERFPGSTLDLFVDRDRSGYTFSQREDYQIMRTAMLAHKYDILIVKDLSRFSRRNSYGLVELETLRDAGIRIIAIGDNIDYPTNDDWLRIQIYFFMNEMPVTDTSKKVRNVIKRRQADGKWICSVPYGYRITNTKTMAFEVDEAAAEIVRKVFELYIVGWGYKRISNHLTDQHIPTPRMNEIARKHANGEETKLRARAEWSVATVQGILENDFYIGTLRQGKYTRKTINGEDVKLDESDHKVFEHHHEAIVSDRDFAVACQLRRQRTRANYNGVRKYANPYSGLLFCGDCGSPMFSLSRPDLRPAYNCGAYHRRGRSGCTSHHVLVPTLDRAVRHSIRQVRDHAAEMMEYLQKSIESEESLLTENRKTAVSLEEQLMRLQNELKATKSQKVRDCLRHPENTDVIEETYDAIESELSSQITGVKNQLRMNADHHKTTAQVNRTAKTVLEVFDRILSDEPISRDDLQFVIERITVCDDVIDVKLKADVEELLCFGDCAAQDLIIQQDSTHRPAKAILVRTEGVNTDNTVSDGDPLEIYTDKEGGVIFKKYSLMSSVTEFASQLCETLARTSGKPCAITDRDGCIAVSGVPRRELLDKRVSPAVERLMEDRQIYQYTEGDTLPACADEEKYRVATAAPILSEGDVLGCVIILGTQGDTRTGEVEYKLAQTVAGFLGKHMES